MAALCAAIVGALTALYALALVVEMDGAVTNITKVLQWNKRPELVLVVKRFYSQSVISPFIELIHWLILEQKMTVYIEENVINDDSLMECFFDVKHLIKSLSSKLDCEKIEFVITLGGDGTLIHAIWLFQNFRHIQKHNHVSSGENLPNLFEGLIISTPTGSTAYSASTGASVIHPSVSAILIAISPNSLENNAWVVFDGVKSLEISYGDNITISISSYPLPSICAQNQTADWFQSLRSCMSWNS
ncbi:NAD kinase-like [Lycorma delicatula]|uniref:NAD kinase-like n=1 Tax=Lycorma delicatula TaxID=130591 RepID=UPI003F516A39